MKRMFLLFPLSVLAAQPPLPTFDKDKERSAFVEEYKKLMTEVETVYEDIRHPESAVEKALEAYIIKVIEAEVKSIAEREAKKILAELNPFPSKKEK